MKAGAGALAVSAVVTPLAGLVVWAAHFAAIYAISAVACERGLAGQRVLGLPWVAALVGLATVVALVVLAVAARPAWHAPRGPVLDGGEAEPQFSRWLAGSSAALAALAVLFQALPAALLPGCG